MIWELIILILGVPAGYLIAWLARDELVIGKKYFRILIIASLIAGGWFFLTGLKTEGYSMGFILIVSLVSFLKSENKKFVKR